VDLEPKILSTAGFSPVLSAPSNALSFHVLPHALKENSPEPAAFSLIIVIYSFCVAASIPAIVLSPNSTTPFSVDETVAVLATAVSTILVTSWYPLLPDNFTFLRRACSPNCPPASTVTPGDISAKFIPPQFTPRPFVYVATETPLLPNGLTSPAEYAIPSAVSWFLIVWIWTGDQSPPLNPIKKPAVFAASEPPSSNAPCIGVTPYFLYSVVYPCTPLSTIFITAGVATAAPTAVAATAVPPSPSKVTAGYSNNAGTPITSAPTYIEPPIAHP